MMAPQPTITSTQALEKTNAIWMKTVMDFDNVVYGGGVKELHDRCLKKNKLKKNNKENKNKKKINYFLRLNIFLIYKVITIIIFFVILLKIIIVQ